MRWLALLVLIGVVVIVVLLMVDANEKVEAAKQQDREMTETTERMKESFRQGEQAKRELQETTDRLRREADAIGVSKR